MRTPVRGEVRVEYSQTYVESDPDCRIPDLHEAFAGQRAGLCGAATPGFLWLATGLHTGRVGFTVEVHDEEPALDPAWEEAVEASFHPVSDRTRLAETDLGLPMTDHRVRYCARAMDEGRQRDTRSPGEPPADDYLLQFWPAPPAPARVVRQTSSHAAYWHDFARELPPPPTPEERAEAARRARQAEARAAEERRFSRERWEWGGRLPSDTLRAVGGNVRGLLRFDPDLPHTLDATPPDVQRRVAVLAARRACETAGLTDIPWIAQALTALDTGRPLPPPFEDHTSMFDALRADPRVPDRSVREAVPPQRKPYRPPEPVPGSEGLPIPRPAPMPASMPAAKSAPHRPPVPKPPALAGPVPTVGAAQYFATYHEAGEPRPLHRVSQPHFALPAIPAAADPNPLRAALDAVWHALGTYGEHYPRLLAEVRALCGDA